MKSKTLKLKRGQRCGGYRRWSVAESHRLFELFPALPTKEAARALGRSVSSLIGHAAKLGLKKDPAYLRASLVRLGSGLSEAGQAQRFPKGHVPANKGWRRPGWFRGRMRETMFKKGHRPHTWRPVGSLTVDADGYVRLKIRKGGTQGRRWRPLHILVWLNAGRRIPSGYNLQFKDGNRRNFALSNLELVSRRENMKRNSIHRYPPELKRTIQLNAGLKRRLDRLERKAAQDGEKQAA